MFFYYCERSGTPFHNHTLNYRPLLGKRSINLYLGDDVLTSSSLVFGVRKEAYCSIFLGRVDLLRSGSVKTYLVSL